MPKTVQTTLPEEGETLFDTDEKVLRHVVPRGFFYNVMITGVKPGN